MKYLKYFESLNFNDKVISNAPNGDSMNRPGDVSSTLTIDDKYAGTLQYRIKDNYLYIIMVSLNTEFRGNGYGSEIMQEIIQRAKNEKCNGMKLEVLTSNTIAINLYKKFGFVIDKQDNFFYNMTLNF